MSVCVIVCIGVGRGVVSPLCCIWMGGDSDRVNRIAVHLRIGSCVCVCVCERE